MRRLAVSCAWEYPPEVFCIHKPCKARCFHYGHGVNSWGSCLASSVASRSCQRVWKNRKHCWRPDMPLPYSHEADWKHQHQEQANKCRSHCLYLLESQTEECSGWPWTVALSVAHSCALGCTPSMSADPPRHQGKVRFLRDASLLDPPGATWADMSAGLCAVLPSRVMKCYWSPSPK